MILGVDAFEKCVAVARKSKRKLRRKSKRSMDLRTNSRTGKKGEKDRMGQKTLMPTQEHKRA